MSLRRARSFVLIFLFTLITRPLTGLALDLTNDTKLQLNINSSPILQIQVGGLVVSSTNIPTANLQTLQVIQVSPTPHPSSPHHSPPISSPTTKTKPSNAPVPSSSSLSPLSTPAQVPSTPTSLSHSQALVSISSTTTLSNLSFVTDFKGAYTVPSPIATLSLNSEVLNSGSSGHTSSPSISSETNPGETGVNISATPSIITGNLPASVNPAKESLMPWGNLRFGIYAIAGCALSLVL